MILWYIKNSIFLYQKLVMIFDITNSILWYHYIAFLISRNPLFWYLKINFVCDITKYFVISQIIFLYHKIEFVISKNEFVISQNRGVYSKTAPHTIRRLGANG